MLPSANWVSATLIGASGVGVPAGSVPSTNWIKVSPTEITVSEGVPFDLLIACLSSCASFGDAAAVVISELSS